MWVDSWDVLTGTAGTATFRFTHAVTPVDASHTRHIWRVSRQLRDWRGGVGEPDPLFTDYYDRVRRILETMQKVITLDGPRDDVSVAADAAALQVRKIVSRMVAEERQA
jgi:vanillate O-demethylase monooxygenase subunit